MHSSAAINREATLKKQTNKKQGQRTEREVENKLGGSGSGWEKGRESSRGGRGGAGNVAAEPNQREEGGYQLYARIPRDDEYMIPTNS